MAECKIEGCEGAPFGVGLCNSHYYRLRKYGNAEHVYTGQAKRFCDVDGCGRKHYAKGYCKTHWQRWSKHGDPGTVIPAGGRRTLGTCSRCERPAIARDMCGRHYQNWRRGVSDADVARIGAVKAMRQTLDWRDLTSIDKLNWWESGNGYPATEWPEHPGAAKNGRIHQHTAVMCAILGRPLVKGENVHHKNGIRDDNRPENLELWVQKQPYGQRAADLVAWAREILDRYGDLPPEAS